MFILSKIKLSVRNHIESLLLTLPSHQQSPHTKYLNKEDEINKKGGRGEKTQACLIRVLFSSIAFHYLNQLIRSISCRRIELWLSRIEFNKALNFSENFSL